MRVSESMLFRNSLTDARSMRSKLLTAQNRISSGIKVASPSSNPASYLKAKRLDEALVASKAYSENIARGRAGLQTTEGVLGEINTILARLKELTVQMSNGVHDEDGRAAAAMEIDELRETLIQIGNTKIGDEYLFAGNLTSTVPYDATGLYHGDTNQREVEVGNGIRVPITIPGESVFNAAGGVDLFQVMDGISTELNNNDPDAVALYLDDIDKGIAQVVDVRSQIGNYLGTTEIAETVLEQLNEDLRSEKSRLIDADVMEAASDMAVASHGLEASLSAISKVMGISLVNRL